MSMNLDAESGASGGATSQTTVQTLSAMFKAHRGRLTFALGFVAVENALMLLHPLCAGFAVDALLRSDVRSALIYAAIVLAFWVFGALRRMVDTRIFTRIYAELAVPVILTQRTRQQPLSAIAARAVLARELVDFFEKHVPTMATTVVSLFGAVAMLVFLELRVGLGCLVMLIVFSAVLPYFAKRSETLHRRLNNRLEREVGLVGHVSQPTLMRHYRMLSRLRVALSDREAIAYLAVGAAAAMIFVFAIVELSRRDGLTAGHIYSVITYLWTFVSCIDEVPSMVDQMARLKDIGKRVAPGIQV